MADEKLDLTGYLTGGIENIVRRAMKGTLKNPRESAYLARYAMASRKASKKRREADARGSHVPPFLIASITNRCNLHCAGCYSRAVDMCTDYEKTLVDAETWGRLFREAASLGVGFVFLAGGEPLMYRAVLEEAAKVKDVFFPVFTNGTMVMKGHNFELFDDSRNLLPVFSMEGNEETTDARRGRGVYAEVDAAMAELRRKGIPYGVSLTLTKDNLDEALSDGFVDGLYGKGCMMVLGIEYVPAEKGTGRLAPGRAERDRIDERLASLRSRYDDMILLSFPGDERKMSGCLASGRGFFHINPQGGAEPCPFSPYSDVNVKDAGIAGALESRLFRRLRESGMQEDEHEGGCALFDKGDDVRALIDADGD